jgi:hypothetical protein
MSKLLFAELSAWLMQAGLAGTAETDIASVASQVDCRWLAP